ncbi:YeeE/YedE thiosulfate transporter family protein [Desulfitibacter alkalitolerans]|uniref:YeeE/YedE thiosulfate transporter family protein n=1 Tax=Desulfitibacter alkalitolerans TaxID=264641 RepID=UPI00047F0CB8|nr:YeeE/YedE thiosulfate transporter family protein [Desulfitibacter alkalitolerans]
MQLEQKIVHKKVKVKKDQKPLFFIVFFLALLLLYKVGSNNLILGAYWAFGIAFGFVLQKSRFCFAASLRDPIIAGSTSILRAIIVAVAIMTITFSLIQYISLIQGASRIPGFIHPVGFHTAVGGFLFGVGMVIAGGCATGTLMRIGEGFLMQLIVLIGFLIGTLLGARHFPWWEKRFISDASTIHLASFLGWPGAVFFQVGILVLLFYLLKKYDEKNNIML